MKKYLVIKSHKELSSLHVHLAGKVITADEWIFDDKVLCSEETSYNLYSKQFCLGIGDAVKYSGCTLFVRDISNIGVSISFMEFREHFSVEDFLSLIYKKDIVIL